MKKISIVVLLLLMSFVHLPFVHAINVTIDDTTTTSVEGSITHTKASLTVVNDASVTSIQSVNALSIDNDHVKTVTWGKLSASGDLTMASVAQIASDFEATHPGYRVLAGVNGDYFAYTPSRSISGFIAHGSNLFYPTNHIKYASLGITDTLNYHKQFTLGSYVLEIYDPNTNRLMDSVGINALNQSVLGENQTTLRTASSATLSSHESHFLIQFPEHYVSREGHLHVSGAITQAFHAQNVTQGVVISTTNAQVAHLLSVHPYVRVQKQVLGASAFYDSMVGIDSIILNNGRVPSFGEIGGQSVSNTESRHPRTGVCTKPNGNIQLLTVDGRQAGFSQGVNLREFGTIMNDLGCVSGYNLDGGGSTQMVVRNELSGFDVVNSPSEGPHFPVESSAYRSNYRSVINAVLFVVPEVNAKTSIQNISKNALTLHYDVSSALGSVEALTLFVNNEPRSLDHEAMTYEVLDLLENQYNALSLQARYEIDGVLHEKTVWNQTVNTSYQGGLRELTLPSIVEVSVEYGAIKGDAQILVRYTDEDNLTSRIVVTQLSNGQNHVTTSVHQGMRKLSLSNLDVDAEHTFTVKLFYDLNTKVVEHTEVIAIQFLEEPTHTPTSNRNWVLISAGSIFLILPLVVFVLMRKRVRKETP